MFFLNKNYEEKSLKSNRFILNILGHCQLLTYFHCKQRKVREFYRCIINVVVLLLYDGFFQYNISNSRSKVKRNLIS